MSGQPIPHLPDFAPNSGNIYNQLMKTLSGASTPSTQQQASFLSRNMYTSLPQHAADNLLYNPSDTSTEDHKRSKPHVSGIVDKRAGILDQEDDDSDDDHSSSHVQSKSEKKSHKRAANRLSAQLSRRRRKVFMEELKQENEKLRRKESILNSIPDLVIVFDSAGKIAYVSKSVCTILKFTAEELQDSSFWDRLCEESERMLKAAFMDSLAAKGEHAETVPLGYGMWEVRMVDKDMSQKLVALRGVVHFSGDNPQCVCTIRPHDDNASSSSQSGHLKRDVYQSILGKKISSLSSSSSKEHVDSFTVVSESTDPSSDKMSSI